MEEQVPDGPGEGTLTNEAGSQQNSPHGPYYYFYQGVWISVEEMKFSLWKNKAVIHYMLNFSLALSPAFSFFLSLSLPLPHTQCLTHPHTRTCTPFSLSLVAEDGQQMFLHPVNVRCLLRQYGSLENSPQSISATVVEIEGHTVNEVWLHRFSHDCKMH